MSLILVSTVKPLFTMSPFTAPLHLLGLTLFPKSWVYVHSNVNCNSIYRAPLYTVLFCLPTTGTINAGLTLICPTWEKLFLKEEVIFILGRDDR